MFITCEDGRKIDVGLKHHNVVIPRYPKTIVRRTCMWLRGVTKDGQPIDIEANVTCSPYDNFSRRTGRQMVREKFLPMFEPYLKDFSRVDRREIYAHIYPEFHYSHNGCSIANKRKVVIVPAKKATLDTSERRLKQIMWEMSDAKKDGKRTKAAPAMVSETIKDAFRKGTATIEYDPPIDTTN